MQSIEQYLNNIICGDCIEVLKRLPESCIDVVVTDPPYGLEFMGQDWNKFKEGKNIAGGTSVDTPYCRKSSLPSFYQLRRLGYSGKEGKEDLKVKKNFKVLPRFFSSDLLYYQDFCYRWSKEVFRVLKPGAFMLVFGGVRTFHRLACGIEDAGFEIRDCIIWLYSSGFPKSLNVSKQMEKLKIEGAQKYAGLGTALKPAFEPIIVARKPIEKTVVENVLKYGCGALNIDSCRISTKSQTKGFKGGKRKIYNDLGAHHYDNSKSRYPSNVIFECTCDNPKIVQETIVIHDAPCGTFAGGEPRKSKKNYRSYETNVIIHTNPDCSCFVLDQVKKNASRYFYCAKAPSKERFFYCNTCQKVYPIQDWFIHNHKDKVIHPTQKPLALMEYLVKLATPHNGILLDPFAGTGTTLLACKKLGIKFIGIEQDETYIKIAQTRLEEQDKQYNLF